MMHSSRANFVSGQAQQIFFCGLAASVATGVGELLVETVSVLVGDALAGMDGAIVDRFCKELND